MKWMTWAEVPEEYMIEDTWFLGYIEYEDTYVCGQLTEKYAGTIYLRDYRGELHCVEFVIPFIVIETPSYDGRITNDEAVKYLLEKINEAKHTRRP